MSFRQISVLVSYSVDNVEKTKKRGKRWKILSISGFENRF